MGEVENQQLAVDLPQETPIVLPQKTSSAVYRDFVIRLPSEIKPQIKVIVFDTKQHQAYITTILKQGVSAYLIEDITLDALVQAIQNVMS